jgi:hypothetical protein
MKQQKPEYENKFNKMRLYEGCFSVTDKFHRRPTVYSDVKIFSASISPEI